MNLFNKEYKEVLKTECFYTIRKYILNNGENIKKNSFMSLKQMLKYYSCYTKSFLKLLTDKSFDINFESEEINVKNTFLFYLYRHYINNQNFYTINEGYTNIYMLIDLINLNIDTNKIIIYLEKKYIFKNEISYRIRNFYNILKTTKISTILSSLSNFLNINNQKEIDSLINDNFSLINNEQFSILRLLLFSKNVSFETFKCLKDYNFDFNYDITNSNSFNDSFLYYFYKQYSCCHHSKLIKFFEYLIEIGIDTSKMKLFLEKKLRHNKINHTAQILLSKL